MKSLYIQAQGQEDDEELQQRILDPKLEQVAPLVQHIVKDKEDMRNKRDEKKNKRQEEEK